MKIAVISGSPKGTNSITLQTVNYLEILFPEHSFAVIHAGQMIRFYEKDMTGAMDLLCASDLILFCYPVYTFIVPSQLHRFVELMKESGRDLSGKYVTQITTSKHFYDITAHRFIEENCHDLGMKVLRGLSADMDDLTKPAGRKDAERFFKHILWSMENGLCEKAPVRPPAAAHIPATVPAVSPAPAKAGSISIVADFSESDTNLRNMIARFQAGCGRKTHLVNIREFPFAGGCISCFRCAAKGQCIYRDGFDRLLREEIQAGDAIVLAFTVKDHSMGSRFKLYDDRQFCNGHRTVTRGKPFAYLVSGNLDAEENLRTIIHGRAETGGNYLAGIATDQTDPDREIDALISDLDYAIDHHYTQPADFYGVGGMKIFRDLIWLMQGLMKADHRFYKAHGQYDFPQKKLPVMCAMYLVGGMMSNEKLKKKLGSKMNEGMLMPYTKVLQKAREGKL